MIKALFLLANSDLLKTAIKRLCELKTAINWVCDILHVITMHVLLTSYGGVHNCDSRANMFTNFYIQECEWFNAILCHVRQSLSALEERILCGVHAIPSSMNDITIPLQAGLVPDSWLHVNLQPTAHTLCSWLDGRLERTY